jgi:hypothetical protein
MSGVAADEVFDLLGDFNNDGTVNSTDAGLWTAGSPLADADEDTDVDAVDGTIQSWNAGATLTVSGIS